MHKLTVNDESKDHKIMILHLYHLQNVSKLINFKIVSLSKYQLLLSVTMNGS